MKFLHAADLHIDSPLLSLAAYEGAPVSRIRSATREAMVNLVDLALAETVDLVVLAGDLFDGDWTDYHTGQFFVGQLDRLATASIPVVTLAGNHDAASVMTRDLRMPSGVTVLAVDSPQRVRFDELGVDVIGQGFATRAVEADLAAGYPVAEKGWFTIGLLHTSLDGRPPHDVYAPTSLSVLRSRGYQYWALGHVHTHEVVSTDPYVVFPGNLQGRHLRERGPKGAVLVETNGTQVTSVDHVALDVVRWERLVVDVEPLGSIAELLDTVDRRLGESVAAVGERLLVAQVKLGGDTALHDDLWRGDKQLEAEVRTIANRHGQIWMHSLVVGTRPAVDRDGLLADESLQRLVARVEQLSDDPAAMERYDDLLAPLRKALPASLQNKLTLEALNRQVRPSLETVVALLHETGDRPAVGTRPGAR